MTGGQTSDVWTEVAAVATAGAALVALGVAVVPLAWRRWWNSPRLKVLIAEREPWVRVALDRDSHIRRAWLRMEVANHGRVEARNVKAVVHEWYERPDSTARWQKRDLDPAALHWVSVPPYDWHGGSRAKREPIVSIPKGLSDFTDLIRCTFSTDEHLLFLDDQRPRGFGFKPRNARGEFFLTITVVADNARSRTKYIHYAITPDSAMREQPFSDVRAEDSGPRDYEFIGILAEIERMQTSEPDP